MLHIENMSTEAGSNSLLRRTQEFALEDAHVWFVRFSMDYLCSILACGTRNGRIFVWNPSNVNMHPLCTLKRGTSPKMTVRDSPLSCQGLSRLLSTQPPPKLILC